VLMQDYARDLDHQLGHKGVAHGSTDQSDAPAATNAERLGKQISHEELDLLGEDQVVQLYELRKEATKPVSKPP